MLTGTEVAVERIHPPRWLPASLTTLDAGTEPTTRRQPLDQQSYLIILQQPREAGRSRVLEDSGTQCSRTSESPTKCSPRGRTEC